MYPNAGRFLKQARVHQRRWISKAFGIELDHPERVIIPERLALQGRNFIAMPVVQQAVRNRYPGNPRPLIADALRSQHIPFNLFGPLIAILDKREAARFWSVVVNHQISSLLSLDFETAPLRARVLLGDHTCFDVFITARDVEDRIVAFGVEVKYTEGAYSWGKAERTRMHDLQSCYSHLTSSSGWFLAGAQQALANRHLKQLWRNQLLALAILKTEPTISEVVVVHLFPSANEYQAAAARSFANCLLPGAGCKAFCPITYEFFLKAAREHLSSANEEWIDYCHSRYVIAG